MSIKLGNTDALLYLGDQIADRAYLGTAQVPRVLYFNGIVDGDWDEIGNWWLDDAQTVAATSLPTTADSVVATATITASGQTVVGFTFNDPEGADPELLGSLTVTGMATFNNGVQQNGTITGNATFNGGAGNGGTVTGNATFSVQAVNGGTVTGNATFSGDSVNYGTVTGTATFNGSACNNGGTAGTFVPDPPPSC
jgi:hypothetical protein